MKHTNPNPDNNPEQNTNHEAGQAESQRSGLPRPRRATGKSGRDPFDYETHPYPSMERFAGHLVLSHDTARTRSSYYRQLRLIHQHFGRDPESLGEEQIFEHRHRRSSPPQPGPPRTTPVRRLTPRRRAKTPPGRHSTGRVHGLSSRFERLLPLHPAPVVQPSPPPSQSAPNTIRIRPAHPALRGLFNHGCSRRFVPHLRYTFYC